MAFVFFHLPYVQVLWPRLSQLWIHLDGLVKRQRPRKPVLQPPLPDEGLVLDHEDGISLIADDEDLPHTTLLLCAPVRLRVQVFGWLRKEVLICGCEAHGIGSGSGIDDLSRSRGQLDGSEVSLPEAAFTKGGGEAASQLAVCARSSQPDEHGRIMTEGDGGSNGAALAAANQVAVATAAQGRSALQSGILFVQGNHAAFGQPIVRAAALNNIAHLPATGKIIGGSR